MDLQYIKNKKKANRTFAQDNSHCKVKPINAFIQISRETYRCFLYILFSQKPSLSSCCAVL